MLAGIANAYKNTDIEFKRKIIIVDEMEWVWREWDRNESRRNKLYRCEHKLLQKNIYQTHTHTHTHNNNGKSKSEQKHV